VALLRQPVLPTVVQMGIDPFPRPLKPGGYADSCADLSFLLASVGHRVVMPAKSGRGCPLSRWPAAGAQAVAAAAASAAEAGCDELALWVNAVGCNATASWSSGPGVELFVAQPPGVRVEDKAETKARLAAAGLQQPSSVLVWDSIAEREESAAFGFEYGTGCGSVDGVEAAADWIESSGPGFPVVCKPVCGRGSELVELVGDRAGLHRYAATVREATQVVTAEQARLQQGAEALLRGDVVAALCDADIPAGTAATAERRLGRRTTFSPDHSWFRYPRYGGGFMVEERLTGPEITVTVVPALLFERAAVTAAQQPAIGTRTAGGGAREVADAIGPDFAAPGSAYVSLSPVLRNPSSAGGIMPYNGVVAVAVNSSAATEAEGLSPRMAAALVDAMRQCEVIGSAMGSTMPVRVDMRAATADEAEASFRFLPFDVNVKPNATYPGRTGREDQVSLMALAADAAPSRISFPALASAIVDLAPRLH